MLPSGDKRKRAGIQIPWEKKNGVARVSDTNAITLNVVLSKYFRASSGILPV